MNTARRLSLLTVLVAAGGLLPAPPADAELLEPTPRQAAAIATALEAAAGYWRSDVCAGAMRVRFDTTLKARGRDGEASGLEVRADGSWRIVECAFTIAPGVTGCELEEKVRHELGHFVHGPSMDLETLEHHGPLADEALDAAPCSPATRRLERQERRRETAKRARVKARWLRTRDARIRTASGVWR